MPIINDISKSMITNINNIPTNNPSTLINSSIYTINSGFSKIANAAKNYIDEQNTKKLIQDKELNNYSNVLEKQKKLQDKINSVTLSNNLTKLLNQKKEEIDNLQDINNPKDYENKVKEITKDINKIYGEAVNVAADYNLADQAKNMLVNSNRVLESYKESIYNKAANNLVTKLINQESNNLDLAGDPVTQFENLQKKVYKDINKLSDPKLKVTAMKIAEIFTKANAPTKNEFDDYIYNKHLERTKKNNSIFYNNVNRALLDNNNGTNKMLNMDQFKKYSTDPQAYSYYEKQFNLKNMNNLKQQKEKDNNIINTYNSDLEALDKTKPFIHDLPATVKATAITLGLDPESFKIYNTDKKGNKYSTYNLSELNKAIQAKQKVLKNTFINYKKTHSWAKKENLRIVTDDNNKPVVIDLDNPDEKVFKYAYKKIPKSFIKNWVKRYVNNLNYTELEVKSNGSFKPTEEQLNKPVSESDPVYKKVLKELINNPFGKTTDKYDTYENYVSYTEKLIKDYYKQNKTTTYDSVVNNVMESNKSILASEDANGFSKTYKTYDPKIVFKDLHQIISTKSLSGVDTHKLLIQNINNKYKDQVLSGNLSLNHFKEIIDSDTELKTKYPKVYRAAMSWYKNIQPIADISSTLSHIGLLKKDPKSGNYGIDVTKIGLNNSSKLFDTLYNTFHNNSKKLDKRISKVAGIDNINQFKLDCLTEALHSKALENSYVISKNGFFKIDPKSYGKLQRVLARVVDKHLK